MRYEEFVHLVQHHPAFAEFRELFAHEALQRFVYHEKCILGSLSETRIFHNQDTGEEGGIAHSTQVVLDECYGVYTPFDIKGVWIPLTQGTAYSILPTHESCPLIRTIHGEEKFLYLIHPKSESLYTDLFELYQDNTVTLKAISLSSPRSLLVSLPKESGGFKPIMVKVSLNQKAHDTLRLLTERECALSVANTSIFGRILKGHSEIDLHILEDTFAFVPKYPVPYEHGMIYRELPSFLKPSIDETLSSSTFAVPLLAFYGQKNSQFFKDFVDANGGNVTQVLKNIFEHFISAALPLLLDHKLSMEAHGQNLLLILNHELKFMGLMYRDMGGVNTAIDAHDTSLPAHLRQPSLSYFDNHVKDAANALEHHFIWRGLYPLTKQLVKHAAHFSRTDPDFKRWYDACLQMQSQQIDVLKNWTDGEPDSDAHITHLTAVEFCRYGYTECLFGELLIDYLETRLDSGTIDELRTKLYSPERIADDLWLAPCSYKTFFDEAIQQILSNPTFAPTLTLTRK